MSASFSIVIAGKGTFTASIADPEASVTVGTNTPASFTAAVAPVGPAGAAGATGATGPAGVVAATAPITYNSGTQTVAIDTAYFVRSPLTAPTDGQIISYDEATTRPLWIDNDARTLFAKVRNQTGATLTAGTVVYISGASGNKALVTKAQANSESTSSGTFAVISASIANNHNGTAVVAGELGKLDTTAFAEGATLYLSPTTAGAFTTTKPVAPNHIVYVATVTRVHANLGTIEVRIQNGSHLDEQADVLLTSNTNNDLLVYESATSLWKNKSFATLGLLTAPYNPFNQTLDTSSSVEFNSILTTIGGFGSVSEGVNITASGARFRASDTSADKVTLYGGTGITFSDATVQTTAFTGPQDLSAYATLASPTFTGNPIAPTPTAGDNDTSIATTAFVTTANPDATTSVKGHVQLATLAEAKATSDDTKAITSAALNERAMSTAGWNVQLIAFSAGSTGTGAAASGGANFNKAVNAPTTAIGYGVIYTQGYGIPGLGKGYNFGIDWTRRVIMSARLHKSTNTTDANSVLRLTLGKSNSVLTPADLSAQGIGIKIAGSGAINIICHNGTGGMTTSATSFTPTTTQWYDVVLISDGAGNVTCYVNGSQVGTTTGGPTTMATTGTRNMIMFEAENLAIITGSTTQYLVSNFYIYVSP